MHKLIRSLPLQSSHQCSIVDIDCMINSKFPPWTGESSMMSHRLSFICYSSIEVFCSAILLWCMGCTSYKVNSHLFKLFDEFISDIFTSSITVPGFNAALVSILVFNQSNPLKECIIGVTLISKFCDPAEGWIIINERHVILEVVVRAHWEFLKIRMYDLEFFSGSWCWFREWLRVHFPLCTPWADWTLFWYNELVKTFSMWWYMA